MRRRGKDSPLPGRVMTPRSHSARVSVRLCLGHLCACVALWRGADGSVEVRATYMHATLHRAGARTAAPSERVFIHINITRGDPVHSTTQDTAVPASDKLVLDPPGQLLLAELKVVVLGSVEV